MVNNSTLVGGQLRNSMDGDPSIGTRYRYKYMMAVSLVKDDEKNSYYTNVYF